MANWRGFLQTAHFARQYALRAPRPLREAISVRQASRHYLMRGTAHRDRNINHELSATNYTNSLAGATQDKYQPIHWPPASNTPGIPDATSSRTLPWKVSVIKQRPASPCQALAMGLLLRSLLPQHDQRPCSAGEMLREWTFRCLR